MSNIQSEITIKRTVTRVLSYDGKTGECHFVISNDSAVLCPFAELSCRATVPFLSAGMPLMLTGEYIDQTEEQRESYLNVSKAALCIMEENDMVSFLKKIEPSGKKNEYRKFLRTHGCDVFSFIKEPDAREVLTEYFSVLEKQEERDGQSIGTNLYLKLSSAVSRFEVFDFLQAYGIPADMINHACACYPMLTTEHIIKYPYSLASDFDFPFDVCDSIALDNGIDRCGDLRMMAIVKEALKKNEEDGNTCSTVHSLKTRVNGIIHRSSVLRNETDHDSSEYIDAEELLYCLSSMKGIVYEKAEDCSLKIYLEKTWHQENCIAKHRKRLDLVKKEYVIDKTLGKHVDLSDEQMSCLNALSTSGIKILIGGPGTGKTTVIGEMVRIFHANHPKCKIALCAPTGRASQKMKEVSDSPAMTAQKLINFKSYGDTDIVSEYDENNNLPYDLIIADEWSMGDNELTAILLRAVKNGAIVIFSGDVNQLDSVGCGCVLSDFISSGVMEVYRLTKIFRQKEDNLIIKNAYKIINGETVLEFGAQFQCITVSDTKEIMEKVLETVKREMEQSGMDNVQVLCTYKKCGIGVGVCELNKSIKKIINPSDKEISVGDKAIMTKNNYKKSYFNGDMGIVTSIGTDYRLTICSGTLSINRENLCDMELAYAITVHKSQGSEYPAVIIVLPKQFRSLRTRNLLYTAVTRAKEKVIIIEEEGILTDTILNVSKKRFTGLADKLKGKKIKRLEVNSL